MIQPFNPDSKKSVHAFFCNLFHNPGQKLQYIPSIERFVGLQMIWLLGLIMQDVKNKSNPNMANNLKIACITISGNVFNDCNQNSTCNNFLVGYNWYLSPSVNGITACYGQSSGSTWKVRVKVNVKVNVKVVCDVKVIGDVIKHISPAKYSSWQEMRAVLFRKACSNSVYWLCYF